MGCSSCGKKALNGVKNTAKIAVNLGKAAIQQPDKIKWFKSGAKGLLKCLDGITLYSDEDIQKNRDVCRECEFATKTDGKLTSSSQCMARDPETGAPCACIIMCKTQVGKCPLNKWVSMTIKAS